MRLGWIGWNEISIAQNFGKRQTKNRIQKILYPVKTVSFLYKENLLEFDLCASLFQFSFDFLSLSFGSSLFDWLWTLVNQSLSLFQTQTGDLFNQFDNAHLGSASVFQDNVKLGFLLSSSGSSWSSSNSYRSSSGNAKFFFKCFYELSKLNNSQFFNILNKC